MNQRCCSVTGSSLIAASTKMANKVRDFLETSLKAFTSGLFWLQSLRYKLWVACCHCLNNGDKCSKHKSASCSEDECLHLYFEYILKKSLFVQRGNMEKWFQAYTAQIFLSSLMSYFLISQNNSQCLLSNSSRLKLRLA